MSGIDLGEAADWLDQTVSADIVSSLSVAEWITEIRRLKTLNERLVGKATPRKAAPKRGFGTGNGTTYAFRVWIKGSGTSVMATISSDPGAPDSCR